MSKHNLELLVEAARFLKPLLGELVFVGGSTTALLITDKAAAEVRPTYDVDAIAEISSYAAYADFSERLRRCGFREDASEGAPTCRRRQKTSCRSTRRSWDSPTAGTSRLCEWLAHTRHVSCGLSLTTSHSAHSTAFCNATALRTRPRSAALSTTRALITEPHQELIQFYEFVVRWLVLSTTLAVSAHPAALSHRTASFRPPQRRCSVVR